MLRNIFPDEPGIDQKLDQAGDPGAYFAEFLPSSIAVSRGAVEQGPTTPQDAVALHHHKHSQQQQRRSLGDGCDKPQPQDSEQQAAAHAAAAAARVSADQAAAAAATAAATAARQAAEADLAAAPADGLQRKPDEAESSDNEFDIPRLCEIRSALTTAWFGSSEDAADGGESSTGVQKGQEGTGADGAAKQGHEQQRQEQRQQQQQKEEEEEEEGGGVLERLLPFGRESTFVRKAGDLVPSFKSSSRRNKKPLRLKVAEQVLSKEMLSAVQLIETEILSSAEPLPAATIKYFLRTGRTMGTGWARSNLPRVFGFLSAYVAATCGLMAGVKAGVKWLAWRIPRVGRRVTGPAMTFTADVLLPTGFFGPFLATYVLLMIVCKPKENEEEEEGETATADRDSTEKHSEQHQEAADTRTRSRDLQLEFVQSPPKQRHKGAVRFRQQAGRAGGSRGFRGRRGTEAAAGAQNGAAAAGDVEAEAFAEEQQD